MDFVHHVDLGMWSALSPTELARSPELVNGYAPRDAAARALKYARAAGLLPYDEIGFRSLAATPVKGHSPLQTFAQARLDTARERRRKTPADLDLLLTQTHKLRHRPLTMPAGRVNFTVNHDTIDLTLVAEPGRRDDGVVWSFPRGAPPPGLIDLGRDQDERLLYTQYAMENVPPVYWLPLPRLVEAGRFGRMQDIAGDLVPQTAPGNYYCFISHRWLTPTAPDPDGMQAGLAAWQLAAAMCEAVYVAYERGLHTPRKVSDFGPLPIGPFGSDVAEALIVNVLRYALDAGGLAAVHAEILPLQRETADLGVPAGNADTGLRRLRELVATHPRLRVLLDRVFLWYDYSCLPQEPRSATDQEAFTQAMRRLDLYQLLGRTTILLDDADDYLTRAWCTLEALTARSFLDFHALDVLVGSDRPTVTGGRPEHHLTLLLQDRPHVVWRGLVDTEVFGVQAPVECLRRLELTATDDADLPVIYEALLRIGMPKQIHIDESEIVTGTLPLPAADHGRTMIVPATGQRPTEETSRPVSTASLNWTAVGNLADRTGRARNLPSFVEVPNDLRRRCHVVVIGSCEGEAMLVADWTMAHEPDLEQAAGATIQSVSWLAMDVAPVGHFAEGVLRTRPVDAPLWIVVALHLRFDYCPTTAAIVDAVTAAGLPYVTIAIDLPVDNVKRYAPAGRSESAARVEATPVAWPGGLFREHLLGELRRAAGGRTA